MPSAAVDLQTGIYRRLTRKPAGGIFGPLGFAVGKAAINSQEELTAWLGGYGGSPALAGIQAANTGIGQIMRRVGHRKSPPHRAAVARLVANQTA